MRYLFACAGILFLLSGAAHADTHVQGPGKIVFETHVFTWSFQKQV